MADDSFASELDALFDQTPAFHDSDAFARAVERRLEPAAGLSPVVRGGLIGAAAAVGGLCALRGLAALSASALGLADRARTSLDQLSLNLPSVAGAPLDPTLLWAAAGLAITGAALYGVLREN